MLPGCFPLTAQPVHPEDYAGLITRDSLAAPIEFLADSARTGRETGTPGGADAARYIAARFEQYGLRPLGSPNPLKRSTTYLQPFYCTTRQQGKNVIGLLPATDPACRDYIILSAHYDHLGTLKGVLYPGADCNASGVSVLLNIARTLSAMKAAGEGPDCHYIFVCYDAKEYSIYNSPAFAQVYFEMTEQSFLDKLGVPSVLVTSGVHDHTYKPTDTPALIDYPVLEQRARWLFFTLWDLGAQDLTKPHSI